MVCGRNYHSEGNIRVNGCGQGFDWELAKLYVPEVQAQPALKEFDMAPPEAHEEVEHSFYTCDHCKKPIKGYRFSCINCAVYDLCADCEANYSAYHNPRHLFNIV